jgi:Sulfate permease family
MTGRKHRYNMEVVAQGIANVASALFGGISVTGTIARTATNIRAGACSSVSGMMHALIVLMFIVVASPLASFIPLSTLAGVLVVVCWNMAEEEFLRLLHDWRSASVLIATFGLTLIEDLTSASSPDACWRRRQLQQALLVTAPQAAAVDVHCRPTSARCGQAWRELSWLADPLLTELPDRGSWLLFS